MAAGKNGLLHIPQIVGFTLYAGELELSESSAKLHFVRTQQVVLSSDTASKSERNAHLLLVHYMILTILFQQREDAASYAQNVGKYLVMLSLRCRF